jgi:Ni,Fe-hydrogenase III large subunit/Ni,Fe-hydrogenase III component G
VSTVEQIVKGFPEQIRVEKVWDGSILVRVAPGDLPAAARSVRETLDGRFVLSAGTDKRELAGCYEVSSVFSLDREKTFLVLRTEVDPAVAAIPSITDIIPGANWAEREVRDLIGVVPVGHPDPRRLVLPDDWPDGVYPLRRDFPFNERPEPAPDQKTRMRQPPADTTVLPIGPFFPTLEEPTFVNLFVRGEQIVGMDYRGFYNHRGIEKLADSELTYHQVPFLAERICGICGCVHGSSYCQAVEAAAGIQVPDRARYIRTILLELERVHSHLLWLGLACHFIAFDTLFMQAWRIREPAMWLCEYITGNRKTYGMNQVGGVLRDLPEDAAQRILPVVDRIEKEVLAVVDAILDDGSLKARLQGAGILSVEDARALCVVGPTARGSGLAIDARRDHPFAAYPELDFEVCVEQSCDNWARTMVRIRELFESIKIIRQALAKLPPGPVRAEVGDIEPGLVGVSGVEAPRGEVIHYVLTGLDRPYRWRVRAPSYNNLQGIPAMLKGMTIADAPLIIGSIDPCFSCTERIGVIDQEAGTYRVYRQEELLRMSQK